MNAEAMISALLLAPHPEGGYFRETYRAAEHIPAQALASGYGGVRSVSTAIYFMLTADTFSAFHRLRSDEIWHFYDGEPIRAELIHPDGRHERIMVGRDVAAGEVPQVVFPAGCWFGARMAHARGFGLIGCTVAPGFDFRDFELARRDELIDLFPMHAELITSLTRG